MKRCPECGREYDNTMAFCLDDGAELLYGPASMDEGATAILDSFRVPSSGGIAEGAKTQLLENRKTSDNSQSEIQHPQLSRPPEGGTQNGTQGGTRNAFDKRLLLAPLAIAMILLAGFAGYRYFGSGAGSGQITSIAVLP